jgi:hypothetical protein
MYTSFNCIAVAKAANGLQAKAEQGVISGVAVTSYSETDAYLILANQAAAVASFTNQYSISVLIPAGSTIILGPDFFSPTGVACSAGIAVGISTTGNGSYAAAASEFDISIAGA